MIRPPTHIKPYNINDENQSMIHHSENMLLRDISNKVLDFDAECDGNIDNNERCKYVYLINQVDTIKYKIGFSGDPHERLLDLKTASPIVLRLILTCRGGPELEKIFHRRYIANMLCGEWFEFNSDTSSKITREMSSIDTFYKDLFETDVNDKDSFESALVYSHIIKEDYDEYYNKVMQSNNRKGYNIYPYASRCYKMGKRLIRIIYKFIQSNNSPDQTINLDASMNLAHWLMNRMLPSKIFTISTKLSTAEVITIPVIPNTAKSEIRAVGKIVAAPPRDIAKTDQYKMFADFMNDESLIKFGKDRKIITTRLVSLFNQTTGQNISFNHTFPKLMQRYMENNSRGEIVKKVMTEGTVYLGVGLAVDEEYKPRSAGPCFNPRLKEKQERRASRRKIEIDNLRERICAESGWSDIEYMGLTNMRFITVIMNEDVYDIISIINIAKTNIIIHTHNSMNKLNKIVRGAKLAVKAFHDATEKDYLLSNTENDICYVNRLQIAPDTHSVGDLLDKDIKRFNNSIVGLPRIDHIVYPDIQHLESIVSWLKSRSVHELRKEMSKH